MQGDAMIKNLIFDLGGVICDIDFSKTFTAFNCLGGHRLEALFSQAKQDMLFDDFETGKIDAHQFRAALTKALNISVSDEVFDEAWNALLLGIPIERLDFIKFLQKKRRYRIFLFSNINCIHHARVLDICKAQHGFDNFDGYFEKQYYSHLYGQRKPHAAAFLSILADNHLNPEETLFVDDTAQHIQGAQKAGLHTFHLTRDKSLHDVANFIDQYKPI